MKRSIIAVIVAAAAFASFNASAIDTGLNGVTSGAKADAINNAYGHSYMDAKNSQSVTKGQMAKAGKQAQVAANNAMAAGLHTAAAQSYTKNDPTGHAAPTASTPTAKSQAMSSANVAGAKSTAAPGANNTMDQGVKNDPTGHAAPTASQATSVSKAMSAANVAGAKATAQTSTPDMGAITAGKMASASNPVGAAPNTMDQGVKSNPAGNPVSMVAGTKQNPTGNTINQAASAMNPSTPVSVTDKSGKVTKTTAGAIAKATPDAQIAVNYNSQFNYNQPKGGNNHDRSESRSEHGTGNGSNNAANSRSGNGIGGGNHIGGGSAQSGSRNVGHW